MKANVEIDAGVCGFRTTACATSQDNQNVTFDLADCLRRCRLPLVWHCRKT